jgi:multiple sugar transport system ATP-binding protein
VAKPALAGVPERLVVGVRPEDVHLAKEGDPGAARFEVAVSEPLGAETHMVLRAGDVELRVRAPGFDPRPMGAAVHVTIDASRVHLFAATPDGKRLG